MFGKETKTLMEEVRIKVGDQFSADIAAKVAEMMESALDLR
jgi:hypothetical protein